MFVLSLEIDDSPVISYDCGTEGEANTIVDRLVDLSRVSWAYDPPTKKWTCEAPGMELHTIQITGE